MNRGSLGGGGTSGADLIGFNEAPIHESGKSLTVAFQPVGFKLASMRPRFMNRGSAARARLSLLFSIGFNEAPIHESGK